MFLCVQTGVLVAVPLAADSVPTVAAHDTSPRRAAVARQLTNLRRDSAKTRHLTVVVVVVLQ